MPTRRLLLLLAITSFLSFVLFSISGVNAENLNSYQTMVEDGAEEDGDWLKILKSPDSPYVKRGDDAEFTIVVINTSTQFDMVDIIVSDSQAPNCNNQFSEIGFGDSEPYSCKQENVENAFTNEIIVSGRNATNNKTDTASATADIEVLELLATIEPETSAVPSPGGELEFSVTVRNLSSVPVILDSLVSDKLGNLADPQNDKLDPNTCTNAIGRQLSANSGQYQCKFTTDVSNSPGIYVFDVKTIATVKGDPAYSVSGSGETEIEIFEIISTTLTTKKPKYATGSLINLTMTIRNLSESSSLDILTLEDADLGDVTLNGNGNCLLPQTLQPGESYSCYYQQTVTAEAGEIQPYILNVAGETDGNPPIPILDEARVTITAVQPIAFLPISPVIPTPTSCNTALWVKTKTLYHFYPSNEDAYYKFELENTSNITVNIDNFTPPRGQVNLFSYNGEECNSTINFIDDDGDVNDRNRVLKGENQPPGTYFVRVVSGDEYSSSDSYTLIVNTE